MAAGLVAGGREELCVGAALRCRARSFAGRLVEDRSVDDAAGPLDSADIILITVETQQQYARLR